MEAIKINDEQTWIEHTEEMVAYAKKIEAVWADLHKLQETTDSINPITNGDDWRRAYQAEKPLKVKVYDMCHRFYTKAYRYGDPLIETTPEQLASFTLKGQNYISRYRKVVQYTAEFYSYYMKF